MTDLADIDVRGAGAPPFDASTFVDDLLDAGCHLSLVVPVGHDDRPERWFVQPQPDGRPTPAEATVVARWREAIIVCPDFQARVLEVVRQRVEEEHHLGRSR